MKIKAMNGVSYPAEQMVKLFSDEQMQKYFAKKERDRVKALKNRKGQLDLFEVFA